MKEMRMQSSNRFAHLRCATGSLGQEAFHLSTMLSSSGCGMVPCAMVKKKKIEKTTEKQSKASDVFVLFCASLARSLNLFR